MREFRHGAIEVSTKVRTTHRSLLPAPFLEDKHRESGTRNQWRRFLADDQPRAWRRREVVRKLVDLHSENWSTFLPHW
jgi:hypothetical protein